MVYQHQSTFQKSIESLYKPLKTKLKPLGNSSKFRNKACLSEQH